MAYQANWGPKAFLCSSGIALPLSDLSTTKQVKSESQSDDKNAGKTNLKGLEPYSLKLSTTCLRAAGVDPRAQITEWESLLGQRNPLYIGGKKFGPDKMYLKSVGTSNYFLSNSGAILSVDIDLEFEEYTTKITSLPKAWSSSTKSDEVKRALACTASAADKAAKKV